MRKALFAAGLISALLASVAGAAHADQINAAVRAFAAERYDAASATFVPEAHRGSAVAQTYLGFMYQEGRGVPRDYAEAARWYQAAADQGEPTAQYFLGLLYDRGIGVPHDFVLAEMWLTLAAGHAPPERRDHWADMRNAVTGKLSLGESADAQARANAFVAKHYSAFYNASTWALPKYP